MSEPNQDQLINSSVDFIPLETLPPVEIVPETQIPILDPV